MAHCTLSFVAASNVWFTRLGMWDSEPFGCLFGGSQGFYSQSSAASNLLPFSDCIARFELFVIV